MSNISKEKREILLAFLKELKEKENNEDNIRKLIEIENTLNDKKYGLVLEEHKENIEKLLEENIAVFKEDKTKKIEV